MIIVKIHSITDLITNSSSELFVIKSNKQIDVFKSLVESFHPYYKNNIWGRIYEEPYIALFDYDPKKYHNQEDVIYARCNGKQNTPFGEKEREIRDKFQGKLCESRRKEFNLQLVENSRNYFNQVRISKNNIEKYYKNKYKEVFEDSNQLNLLDWLLSYDYSVSKGDIILETVGDNLIGYETIEKLMDFFGACHIHMG